MVKKIFLRAITSIGMLAVMTVAAQGVASANASKVVVSTGFKPWNSAATQAISDIGVNITTVNDGPNGVPRNDSDNPVPFNRVFTFDSGNCPTGCHLGLAFFGPDKRYPTTNNYSFNMGTDTISDGKAVGFGTTDPNIIADPNYINDPPNSNGAKLRNMQLPEFAWCVGMDANGNPIMHFQTALTGNVNRSVNGGTWKVLWRWSDASGLVTKDSGGGTGSSVVAPANNNNITQVIFVYEENPPTYSINASKTGPNPGGFGTPWKTARMGMDGGNLESTDVTHTFSGIIAAQDHSFFADAPADWQVKGYSYNSGALTSGSSMTIAKDTVPNGVSRPLTWYYDPLPSTIKAGILMQNGSALQNPCSAPANTSGKALCGTVTLQAARTSTDAISAGFTGVGGVIPGAPNAANPGDITNLYPGNYSLTASQIPSGWKVVGYRECGYGDTNCISNNAFTANTALTQNTALYMNRTRPFYYVLAPVVTLPTITASCTGVSGTLGLPAGTSNVKTQLMLGGTLLPEVQTGNAFNFTGTMLDNYRDGETRAIKIVVFYDDINGGPTQTRTDVDASKNYLCANSAQCISNTILTATNGGVVGSGDDVDGVRGTEYTIKVVTKNDGESWWKDWSASGTNRGHRLVLDSTSAPYWDVENASMYVKELTPPVAGMSYPTKNAQSYEFTFKVNLKAGAAINTVNIPLYFRMAWEVNGYADPARYFGPVAPNNCGATVHPQLGYRPWLRVQNGGISSLEKAYTQPAGSRGGRKVNNPTGTADMNLDVQYAATAAVQSMTATNRFCATNAYNYGRVGDTRSCSFAGYTFKVGDKTKATYLTDQDEIWDQAVQMSGYKECANSNYNAARQNLRTYSTDTAVPDTTNPFLAPTVAPVSLLVSGHDRCGIVSTKDITTLGRPSGFPSNTVTISGGRATWLIPHSLYINSNIINGTGWSVADTTDLASLNAVPNLGLIVNGDVTIGPDVSELDVTIYATGRIKTCSQYPNPICNKSLLVRGGVSARGGFTFGRNYFDRDAIATRLGVAASSPNFDVQSGAAINDQGKYYSGPAENFIGNGISLLLPPPGLEDYSANFYRPKYLPSDLSPRF